MGADEPEGVGEEAAHGGAGTRFADDRLSAHSSRLLPRDGRRRRDRDDVRELYDAFTINTILFLEDLGFCVKGEGGAFVEGGRIAPGGALPVNTNGGGLSYCHPGMFGL